LRKQIAAFDKNDEAEKAVVKESTDEPEARPNPKTPDEPIAPEDDITERSTEFNDARTD